SVHSSKGAIGANPAERSDASLSFHIGRSRAHEHTDAPLALSFLGARRERPSGCCDANQSNEAASPHATLSPRIAAYHTGLGNAACASQQIRPTHVRLGSVASYPPAANSRHDCFGPKADKWRTCRYVRLVPARTAGAIN